METVLLTAIEVASALRISKGHSYKMIKSGEIPSVRFGRTVRVKQVDLQAFIAKNASGSVTPASEQAKEVAVN